MRNCIFLLPRMPYPPYGGDKLKAYNMVRILARHYRVELVVISSDETERQYISELEKLGQVKVTLFCFSGWRFAWNVVCGLFSSRPLQVSLYQFGEVKRYVKSLPQHHSFFVINLIRMAPYINGLPQKKYLDIVDSIAMNYTEAKQKTASPWWRLIYLLEEKKLYAFEQRLIAHFDATFFVNKREKERWEHTGNCKWMPNGVNEETLIYPIHARTIHNRIVFLGKMDYQPNVDAVMWLFDHIADHLPGNLELHIIGVQSSAKLQRLLLKHPKVFIKGFIEDAYSYMASSLAVVAPMQTGGGIQNKILEAMALGKVVITSALGAAPITGSIHLENLVIADDPVSFCHWITEIYREPEHVRWKEIGQNARKLIQERYTWQHYEKKLMEALEENLNNL